MEKAAVPLGVRRLWAFWIFKRQIAEGRVDATDQINFPGSPPAFELLLAGDSLAHVGVFLVIDEPMYVIALRESLIDLFLVLDNATLQVVRHPNVEDRGSGVGEDVNGVAMLAHGGKR